MGEPDIIFYDFDKCQMINEKGAAVGRSFLFCTMFSTAAGCHRFASRARPLLVVVALLCAGFGGPLAGGEQPVSPIVPGPQLPPAGPETSATLSPIARRAYAEVLKLKPNVARQLLRDEPAGPGALLVADCADFTELFVSQDGGRYPATVAAQELRLVALAKLPASALRDYAQAEIRLHLGMNQLSFQHEVVGSLNLRQGFQQMQAVVRQHPTFLPARKTLGLGQFAIGSLPSGYHWLLRLLGLAGDVEAGLQNMALAAEQVHDFQTESQVFLAMIRESYYKQPGGAVRLVAQLQAQQPDNLLFALIALSINKRQHHGDAALAAFQQRPTGPAYLSVPYLHHMAADLRLYRGEYAESERENLLFLNQYAGRHYRKDAAFKLYLAAWLGGQPAAAVARYREQINQAGPTDVEEDKYAQQFYHNALALNAVLTRARLQTDGGYGRAALTTLRQFRATAVTPLRDRIEEPYRRARAYQAQNQPDSARLAFEQTLAVAGPDAPYYFAPQAALQLGYLAQEAGRKALARSYFARALAYPTHEYKNSTDTKAKLALRTL